mmetsp:Transcript_5279/g.16601  ORF Transcript_5279/g.16601 Transcript_5279/m.16601 type:complete len:298 (-) Transcript_5279:43-936(-)
MVCDACASKLSKVIVPDKWKAGARNVSDDGGRETRHRNTLLSVRGKDQRFLPSARSCRICRSKVAQDAYYCQTCAFQNGICAMCGKRVEDLRFDKRGLALTFNEQREAAAAKRRKRDEAAAVSTTTKKKSDDDAAEDDGRSAANVDDGSSTGRRGADDDDDGKGDEAKDEYGEHVRAALETAATALALNKNRTIADAPRRPENQGKTNEYSGWASANDPRTGAVYYYHALTKQTSWTWPPDSQQQPQAPSDGALATSSLATKAARGDFIPSSIFTGRRSGYVFTTREPRGTGYYPED